MIYLENVTKSYGTGEDRKHVLKNVSGCFPRGISVGVLGTNGAGKSTLLRLLGGIDRPTSGRIVRQGRISWRLGLSGGFHGSLNGADNTAFVSRIYGADPRAVLAYVENFAELGDDLFRPVKTYSSGMRARLAFGLSLALAFDVYLIDETTAVGDARFQKRCRYELKRRLVNSDIIMVSHNPGSLKEYCTHACILHDGQLSEITDLRSALRRYKTLSGI